MRRILVAGALATLGALMLAPVAMGQSGDLDCIHFASQAAAQAELRANPSDPHGLDGNDDDGIACENNPAPFDLTPVPGAVGNGVGTGGGGQAGDVDCADVTFEEAQAILAADPTDPNRLDADNDGVACEVDDGATAAQTQYEPTPATAQYDQYTPAADQYAAPADDDTDALPATGGPALLLSAGVLLLGTGLLGMKLVRRS